MVINVDHIVITGQCYKHSQLLYKYSLLVFQIINNLSNV